MTIADKAVLVTGVNRGIGRALLEEVLRRGASRVCAATRQPFSVTGVSVHAVPIGPVDTDMTQGLDISKASAESVPRSILDGVAHGDEDIFPDPMSQSLSQSWRSGAAKTLERQYSAVLGTAL